MKFSRSSNDQPNPERTATARDHQFQRVATAAGERQASAPQSGTEAVADEARNLGFEMQLTGVQVAGAQLSGAQLADVQLSGTQLIETQLADMQPIGAELAETQPAKTRPTEEQPTDDSQLTDVQRAEARLFAVLKPRFGSLEEALCWYRERRIPRFGLTAQQMVQEGRTQRVLEYIESVDAGVYA